MPNLVLGLVITYSGEPSVAALQIGGNYSESQMEKLHAPVGLDIGADSPEAIALSIVAEIQAVLHKRAGGFLRERKGSIYSRNDE